MLAISIREPWAWLEANALKDVENRDWPTWVRGRVYVHAGLKPDGNTYEDRRILTSEIIARLAHLHHGFADYSKPVNDVWMWHLVHHRNEQPWQCYYGAIIGEVDITDCVTEHQSVWFQGDYGFLLANAFAYATPVPCKGRRRFFRIPDEIETLCTVQREQEQL